jgi:serine/threonine-protein kinase RsbW
MILFKEERMATLEDVRWLRKTLGRRLEESCLRAIDPKPYNRRLALSLIDSVVLAVTELANNVIQHAKPKPSVLSLEVQLIGSALRIELCNDGGSFRGFEEVLEHAGRVCHSADLMSGRGLSLVCQSLQDIEYRPGEPNRFIGWRKLRRLRPAVLIASADDAEARALRIMLSQSYSPVVARTLEEARRLLATQKIDIVLADYQPAILRENPFRVDVDQSPIPVILLASAEEFDDIGAHPPAYADQCLQKPVSGPTLVAAIEVAMASYTRRLVHLANHFGRSAGMLLANELPRELPGYDLAVISGTAAYGGGDFALALPGKGFTRLVLADIVGHGLKAKAGAIALAAVIRTLHSQRPVLADTLLKNISHIMGNEPAFSDIISTMVVVDAAADGWIEAASAGHPPVAVVSPRKSFVLPVTGPLPGLVPLPGYQVKSCKLERGDKLAIVSDGIDRETSATADFPSRLMARLSRDPERPVSALCADMKSWLTGKLGPAPKDDWTLLLAEYRGLPSLHAVH